jgi:hypothetical protein
MLPTSYAVYRYELTSLPLRFLAWLLKWTCRVGHGITISLQHLLPSRFASFPCRENVLRCNILCCSLFVVMKSKGHNVFCFHIDVIFTYPFVMKYCGLFTPYKNCNIETRSRVYATVDEAVFSLRALPSRADESRGEPNWTEPSRERVRSSLRIASSLPGNSYKPLDVTCGKTL